MSPKKLWLIKYKNGRIQGPLSIDEIIQLISNRVISGEETISVYPGGRWKPISVEPQFYEALLNVLSDESETEIDKPGSDHSDQESYLSVNPPSISSATVIADLNELKDIQKKRRKKRNINKRSRKKESSQEKTVIYHLPEDEYNSEREVLENKMVGEEDYFEPSKKKKKWILPVAASLIIVVAFLFFPDEKNKKQEQDYIVLEKPREKAPALDKEQVYLLTRKATLEYLRSTVTSYMKAQTLLVQAVEGDVKNTYTMAMLCLVYLELWPFTKQDVQSMNIVSNLVHKTSVLNKGGVRSGLCHSVSLIIKGKYEDAKTMVESSLDGLSNTRQDTESNNLVPFFYYLKARILYYLNSYTTVMSYLDTIRKILPKWVAPYNLAADILLQQGKISEALSMYKYITKLNPEHKVSKIKKGLIEYKHFNKVAKAENDLKIALSYPGRVSDQILSEAYFGLAEINVKNRNSATALQYARKAYSYNPANKAARNLVVQIGGLKKLKQTRVKSSQLVYEGDQLFLKNKFRSAIGYYEEAFKVDEGKNALVAVKAAKSYWALSFSDQAIKWLKKAVNANPHLMEAYVLMAEYYSELYDFYNAEKVLQIAFRRAPRSYELYRGKAYLALKKGSYQRVIRYAKMALKIYEADMESYVLLSEAYSKLGDINESLAYATRGLEVDPNAIKTQVAYGKALGKVYGVDTGVDYFRKLVENYPLVIKYRMELVKYLFEDERYKQAKRVLHKIIDIESKYNEAYFYQGRILMFEGNFAGAYEAFLQASILNPSDPEPLFYIGTLRLKEKKYSLAKEQFEKVLKLNKLYPKVHYYLGRIAFLRRKYEKAINQARQESKTNPNLILPYLLAGESYEKMGQHLNCAIEYQKAVERSPENMSFYVKTGRCYRKSGHLDLAVKILKKACGESCGEGKSSSGMRSGDPHLWKELGEVYEMRGNYQEAARSYCNYLNLIPQAPDRSMIQKRMNKLSKLSGAVIKNCG